jgi:uncharacterized protein (DUF488 family)
MFLIVSLKRGCKKENYIMPTLYTIGHSTHTLQEFIEILHAYKITHIIDIRTIPKSRHVPWFNREKLQASLKRDNVSYTHMVELGGLRRADNNSINLGWRNKCFRGYADYMQTAEFYSALKKLNFFLKGNENVAIMCAEAVPWRCHRSLIADAESIRGIKVMHIISKTSIHRHSLTSFAVLNKNEKLFQIYYPKEGFR